MKKLFCIINSAVLFFCVSLSAGHAAELPDYTKKNSVWYPLYKRLLKDGFTEKELQVFFPQIQNAYSQKPMGNKVKELYTVRFVPKKPKKKQPQQPKDNPLGIPYPWYNGYVTKENAEKCRNFIKENEEYFLLAEKKYQVPREILSALIYVETWHGKFLGKFQPLPMLASMSVSTKLSMLPDYTQKLSLTKSQKAWLEEKMKVKADWAYTELKALMHYSLKNGIDLQETPSSIYGAIGYGQFMPSNIPRFGVDGNGDKKIDLFDPADAIPSVANFLHKQGWTKKNLPFKNQVKVLKRYNYSTAYAHTILALAKLTVLEEKEKNKGKEQKNV